MTDQNSIESLYSPDKLLTGFTRSRFITYLIMAVVIHVIILTATSVPYLLDQINPERVNRREAKALEAQQAADAKKKTTGGAVSNASAAYIGATNVPTSVSTGIVAKARVPAGGVSVSNDRTNTAVMKQITEIAKPEEIPSAPGDLGISIQDTNP